MLLFVGVILLLDEVILLPGGIIQLLGKRILLAGGVILLLNEVIMLLILLLKVSLFVDSIITLML